MKNFAKVFNTIKRIDENEVADIRVSDKLNQIRVGGEVMRCVVLQATDSLGEKYRAVPNMKSYRFDKDGQDLIVYYGADFNAIEDDGLEFPLDETIEMTESKDDALEVMKSKLLTMGINVSDNKYTNGVKYLDIATNGDPYLDRYTINVKGNSMILSGWYYDGQGEKIMADNLSGSKIVAQLGNNKENLEAYPVVKEPEQEKKWMSPREKNQRGY